MVKYNVIVKVNSARLHKYKEEAMAYLVSAKEMLDKAKAGHYAVGQFNINNLEWTKCILQMYIIRNNEYIR